MVSLAFYGWFFPFMEFSVYGKKYAKILATINSPLVHLRCYRQVFSIFTLISDYFVKLLLLKCLHSIKTRKLHVRIVVPKLQSLNLRVIIRVVLLGTLYCTQCPSFFTKSQSDLNYHIAKMRSAPKPDITFKCKLCYQEFPGFLRFTSI